MEFTEITELKISTKLKMVSMNKQHILSYSKYDLKIQLKREHVRYPEDIF